jgi:hypothetical protein
MHPDGYFALVLDAPSKALLRARFATLGEPLAHHCTVRYGTRDPALLPPPFTAADLGATFTLAVIGFATRADGGVQAAAVALVLPDGRRLASGFSQNRVPHVTVATDGVTEPVEANALLEAGFAPLDGPLLEARLTHVEPPTEPAA